MNLPDHHITSDSTLWASVRMGDESAFALLYHQYWRMIYTTAFRYLKDKDACAEIVQDIFISMWKKRHHLEIISFPAYLTQAARYRIYKRWQKQSGEKIVFVDQIAEHADVVTLNTGRDKLESDELEMKLDHLLDQLPLRCREIFVLSRKKNLTNNEIAGLLNISKRTVENQLTYALQHLRKTLNDGTLTLLLVTVFNS